MAGIVAPVYSVRQGDCGRVHSIGRPRRSEMASAVSPVLHADVHGWARGSCEFGSARRHAPALTPTRWPPCLSSRHRRSRRPRAPDPTRKVWVTSRSGCRFQRTRCSTRSIICGTLQTHEPCRVSCLWISSGLGAKRHRAALAHIDHPTPLARQFQTQVPRRRRSRAVDGHLEAMALCQPPAAAPCRSSVFPPRPRSTTCKSFASARRSGMAVRPHDPRAHGPAEHAPRPARPAPGR